MKAHWEEAYEAQVELHRFWSGPSGKRMAKGFSEAINVGVPPGERGGAEIYRELDRLEAMKMHQASPMYVSDDFMDMVEVAAESFQPESFEPTDLITHAGFVYLPRPKLMLDAQGKMTTVRCFAWGPLVEQDRETGERGKSGVWLSLYSCVDDFHLDEEMLSHSAVITSTDWGTRYPILHAVQWWFGETPLSMVASSVIKERHSVEVATVATNDWWSFVQVLMRISMQYISTREYYPVPRAQRRRAERQKLDLNRMTIITLRRPRPKKSEGDSEPVDWQFRWVVGGHWRNQWYPSLNMHRQIYISDYIKGPEDRPLALRKGRAFNLVR